MTPYHYAVLRYVHDLSGGEFVNIGIIMWLPESSELMFQLNQRYRRLSNFFANDFEGESYRQMVRHLESHFKSVVDDIKEEYRQPKLNFVKTTNDIKDILSQLVLEDASCFQWLQPRSGICKDAPSRLNRLYEELVTHHELKLDRVRDDENAIWEDIYQSLMRHDLLRHVNFDVQISSTHYTCAFHVGWHNHMRQVLDPISFDLQHPKNIIEKANTWGGRLFTLSKGSEFQFTPVVSAPKQQQQMNAYNRAYAILKEAPSIRQILTRDEVEDFMSEIRSDVNHQKD